VFEALGAGEITLDVAKAYAATPDQERQATSSTDEPELLAQHPDSIAG
jgi:ParB family chromosome partitioning protein